MSAFLKIPSNTERAVYESLCMGIVCCLVFFPLGVSILSILLSLFWLLFTKKQVAAPGDKWLISCFISLYVWLCIGMLYSQNLETAFFKAQLKSGLLFFPLVLGFSRVMTISSIRKINLSLLVSIVAGVLYCLATGFIHYLKSGQTDRLNGYSIVVLKDMNPYMMALICVLAVTSIFEYWTDQLNHPKAFRYFLIFSFFLLSVFIFLIGNRMMVFCWLLVTGFYSLKTRRSILLRWSIAVLAIFATLLATIFIPSLNKQVKELVDSSQSNRILLDQDASLGRSWGGKAIRFAIWECGMDVSRSHPITGVGSGDVQDALQVAYENRQFYFASRYNRYNAHSQYLQELLAGGLIGLFIWLASLVLGFKRAISQSNRQYLVFLGIIIILSFTESILELSKGLVIYSFFNSVYAFSNIKTASL